MSVASVAASLRVAAPIPVEKLRNNGSSRTAAMAKATRTSISVKPLSSRRRRRIGPISNGQMPRQPVHQHFGPAVARLQPDPAPGRGSVGKEADASGGGAAPLLGRRIKDEPHAAGEPLRRGGGTGTERATCGINEERLGMAA